VTNTVTNTKESGVFRSIIAAARSRRLLILAVAALVPVLAGCEAGLNAPTQSWHQPTDGYGNVFHNIAIRNVFVLGAPLGQVIPAGGQAGVFLALVNDGSSDALTKISAPGYATSVTLPGGTVKLASQQGVFLTGPSPEVILHGLLKPLTGGSTVKLILTFQNAGSTNFRVPVMPRAQYYSTFSPPPAPTPSPTKAVQAKATPTATPSASPSGTASPAPTPTPTPSAAP
jgi:copper(I)-binding protein